jgi:TPR repeat protein
MPKTQEEIDQNQMKRVKANDPVALTCLGDKCDDEGDYGKAFEYYRKAAELGDLDGHYNLSIMYEEGKGVQKYKKKEVYHLEEAAIGGHTGARYNLGAYEWNGRRDDERAIKHFIIAAKQGHNEALEQVKLSFVDGIVSKEDYTAALRGHQAAVDATKSKQRDAAEEFCKQLYPW